MVDLLLKRMKFTPAEIKRVEKLLKSQSLISAVAKVCQSKGITSEIEVKRLSNSWSQRKLRKRKLDAIEQSERTYILDYIVDHRLRLSSYGAPEYDFLTHFKDYGVEERRWITEDNLDADDAITTYYRWILCVELQQRNAKLKSSIDRTIENKIVLFNLASKFE